MVTNTVNIRRLSVWSESHQLVFTGIDSEAGVVGERRIEQAQGMGELKLVRQLDSIASARSPTRGGPLADAGEREDRGLLEGRGQEGGSKGKAPLRLCAE